MNEGGARNPQRLRSGPRERAHRRSDLAHRQRTRRREGAADRPGRRASCAWRRAVPVPLRPQPHARRDPGRARRSRAGHRDRRRGHASPVASCSSATPASWSSPRSTIAPVEIQLFISKAVVGDDAFADVKELDLGDWVGVHGTVMTTRTGELSVKPDRRRTAREGDPTAARQVARPHRHRHPVPAALRRPDRERRGASPLRDPPRGRSPAFVARCTTRDSSRSRRPVLHIEAGGAHARPFVTHHNTLDIDASTCASPSSCTSSG